MNKITKYLNRQMSGNVFDKKSICEQYSTDHSVLKITPKYVAFPEKTEDVQNIVKFINELAKRDYRIPIGIRGSGFDTTGADLTQGLLISTEKLNKLKEIDAHDRLVHIESGMTLGQLNSILMSYGLFLPINADPGETIGGLISNSFTDSYSAHYGGIKSFIERIEVVLSDGSVIQTSSSTKKSLEKKLKKGSFEERIYAKTYKLFKNNQQLLKKIKASQNTSGYSSFFDCFEDEKRVDLLPVFFGAQGTLGIITEIILRAEPIPKTPEHIIAMFSSFRTANDFMKLLRSLNPLEIFFYSSKIIEETESIGKKPKILKKKLPENGFILQTSYIPTRLTKRKFQEFFESLPKNSRYSISEKEEASTFHDFQNSLLSYLNNDEKSEKPPIINNFFVPQSELQNFVYNLKFLEKKYKIPFHIYGSYMTNIYSIRPEIKIGTKEGKILIIKLLEDFNRLLKLHKGNIAGGTPEGRLKALITNQEYTQTEKELYKEIKTIFDKNNILSPDIKLNSNPRTTASHLREKTSEKTQI